MDVMSTINGIDLVLFVVGFIGWYLYWSERAR